MFKQRVHLFSTRALAFGAIATCSVSWAAQPFDSARVTRLENEVSVGKVAGSKGSERPAAVADVIEAKDYLKTQAAARAELKFSDQSIVRVGQNSVFSFDADSRTLSLEKGTLLFYITPGAGGGTIKTKSMTAAVTGSLGLVTPDLIASLRDTLHVTVNGKVVDVPQGWAVDKFGNVFMFDWKDVVNNSKLVNFGGPPPTLPLSPPLGPETGDTATLVSEFPGLSDYHLLTIEEAAVLNPQVRDILNKPDEPQEEHRQTPPPPPPPPPPKPRPRPTQTDGGKMRSH